MERHTNAYLNYICPHCFNTLDDCTCESLPWTLMLIDRGIQEHIRIVRDKGYVTTGCCESHYKGDCICIYISFARDYGFGKSISLPDGFKYQKSKYAVIYNYKSKITEEEMNSQKKKKLDELLEWCKGLPIIERR